MRVSFFSFMAFFRVLAFFALIFSYVENPIPGKCFSCTQVLMGH
jgi:hypothetical protein